MKTRIPRLNLKRSFQAVLLTAVTVAMFVTQQNCAGTDEVSGAVPQASNLDTNPNPIVFNCTTLGVGPENFQVQIWAQNNAQGQLMASQASPPTNGVPQANTFTDPVSEVSGATTTTFTANDFVLIYNPANKSATVTFPTSGVPNEDYLMGCQ